jgi:hypothetical protein
LVRRRWSFRRVGSEMERRHRTLKAAPQLVFYLVRPL